jgi:hypothetical protein
LVGTDALLALRSADVAATAITPELIAVGERTTRERGLSVRWQLPDSQALPFADGEFDIVLSCIGAVFPPERGAAARELRTVCSRVSPRVGVPVHLWYARMFDRREFGNSHVMAGGLSTKRRVATVYWYSSAAFTAAKAVASKGELP